MTLLRSAVHWLARHRFTALLAGILLTGLFAFIQMAAERSQGSLSEPLKRGAILDAVYGIGTVTAVRSYSIKPGVISTITDLYVKEGDSVRKGAKLAKIDHLIYSAPFSGVVNFLPFKVGENVFTQIPFLVLTDLGNRYLVVSLEQQGALRIRPGQKAILSFDSLRNERFEGAVESVYSYNSNFLARIDVASLPPEILPDMTADVAIVIREVRDALLIPVSAFESGTVWVRRGRGIPTRVPVQLGVVDGSEAEVLSGELHPGDRLMIRRKVKP